MHYKRNVMNSQNEFKQMRALIFDRKTRPFFSARKENGSLYLSACGTILPRRTNWGLTDRWFHGRSQTECQRGSSGLFTCKARTVARAVEPAFRKAGHNRRLP